MTDYLKDYYADTRNTGEMAAFRKKKGILLLPIGCFEMHGPHTSMSCDTFVAEATCCILAEDWDALVLPPIHYAYPGASTPWPGTVDVSPETTCAYIKEVVTGIMKGGYEKLVLVNIHFPNRPNLTQVVRSVFRETGQVPLLFEIDYGAYLERVREEWDHPYGEALMMLSALHIIGRHGHWDPAAKGQETREGPQWATMSIQKLRQRKMEFGYYFQKPEDHVGQYPDLTLEDAEKGAAVLKEVVLACGKGLPEDYETFIEDTKKAFKEKPWDKL